MGSSVTWMVATLVVTASALVHATEVDGWPRPDGLDDLPTTTLGTKPMVKYAGKPANCTQYSWENVVLPPKDTKNCNNELWFGMTSDTSRLEAYTYFSLDALYSNPPARCIIRCFDLSAATSPNHSTAQPPVSAATLREASIQAPTPSVNSSPQLLLSSSRAPTPSEPPRPSAPASKSQVWTMSLSRRSRLVQALAITRDFDKGELLSSGVFGDVFKGTLASGGAMVTVKRVRREKEHGHASFLAEANTLSQIRHRHLLQLCWWCKCKERLFLVYDFVDKMTHFILYKQLALALQRISPTL